jgi:hypothetical protein
VTWSGAPGQQSSISRSCAQLEIRGTLEKYLTNLQLVPHRHLRGRGNGPEPFLSFGGRPSASCTINDGHVGQIKVITTSTVAAFIGKVNAAPARRFANLDSAHILQTVQESQSDITACCQMLAAASALTGPVKVSGLTYGHKTTETMYQSICMHLGIPDVVNKPTVANCCQLLPTVTVGNSVANLKSAGF